MSAVDACPTSDWAESRSAIHAAVSTAGVCATAWRLLGALSFANLLAQRLASLLSKRPESPARSPSRVRSAQRGPDRRRPRSQNASRSRSTSASESSSAFDRGFDDSCGDSARARYDAESGAVSTRVSSASRSLMAAATESRRATTAGLIVSIGRRRRHGCVRSSHGKRRFRRGKSHPRMRERGDEWCRVRSRVHRQRGQAVRHA